MKVNQMDTQERVAIGTALEDAIALCLNIYHGFSLQKANEYADKVSKIDYYHKRPDEIVEKFQIKSRLEGGSDILVEVYKTFYGIGHPNSETGRDMLSRYDKYVSLSKDMTTIRVIDGQSQKRVISEVLREWEQDGGSFWNSNTFNSRLYPGIQLKKTRDGRSRLPKVVMFIPPKVLKTGPQIQYYQMHFPTEAED